MTEETAGGPSLELEMTPAPRQRLRATQRLTLTVVVTEMRSELHAVKANIEEVRALALAQGERRTEDLRKMIHEEVSAQVAPVLESLKTLTEVIPLVPTLQQLAADYQHRAAEDRVSRERLSTVLTALDRLATSSWQSVKPLLYTVGGLVIASKAQTILALPPWTWWAAAGVMIVLAVSWGRAHAFLTRTRTT